jgi:hypothetical protein
MKLKQSAEMVWRIYSGSPLDGTSGVPHWFYNKILNPAPLLTWPPFYNMYLLSVRLSLRYILHWIHFPLETRNC